MQLTRHGPIRLAARTGRERGVRDDRLGMTRLRVAKRMACNQTSEDNGPATEKDGPSERRGSAHVGPRSKSRPPGAAQGLLSHGSDWPRLRGWLRSDGNVLLSMHLHGRETVRAATGEHATSLVPEVQTVAVM